MLSLDSPEWDLLSHAYGGAFEVPDWLRQLESDPTDELWDAIWSALCHQYTVYSATYAAVPHLVRIAMGRAPKSRFLHYCFIGTVAAHDDPSLDPFPGEFSRALNQAIPLIYGDLQQGPFEPTEAAHLIGALAGVVGARRASSLMEHMNDGEIPLKCARCSVAQAVEVEPAPPILKSYGADSYDVTNSSLLELPQRFPTAIHEVAEFRDDNAEAWLPEVALMARQPALSHRLRLLQGKASCPECGHEFQPLREFLNQRPGV